MLLSRVVSIISGGSSGLGAAAARSILNNGGKVIVADLPHQRDAFQQNVLDKVSAVEVATNTALDDASSAIFAEVDVTNTQQITNALDMGESIFGTNVNAAISCAGICPARKTLSSSTKSNTEGNDDTALRIHSLDEFAQTMNVNTIGTFNLARLASERMVSQRGNANGKDNNNGGELRGCIINTASIAAYDGQIGQVAYASSKGAVVSMTLPMARDLASYGIRVMTIVSYK